MLIVSFVSPKYMTSIKQDTLNYRPKDRKIRLIGVPLVGFSMHFIFHEWRGLDGLFWGELLMDFLITMAFWEGIRQIWFLLQSRFSSYTQTKKRIFYSILVVLVYTLVVTAGLKIIIQLLFGDMHVSKLSFGEGYLASLIPTFMITSVYESSFFFWAWRSNVQKTEALARENVQSQLEALKSQLDPHFLFNSLNTLAALIDDDNAPAQKYLEQLSDVYRYVLVNREKDTVTLEEEMAFLDAYVYLNKIRFRENLQIETQISTAAYEQHIAPLSLQMLVENAIKHNVVARDNPLKIKIWQEGNYLIIRNNWQEKKTFEKSTKVGLENIINRYDLLTTRRVEVWNDTISFCVKLPLLEIQNFPLGLGAV